MSIFSKQAAFLTAGNVEFPVEDSNDLYLASTLVSEEYHEWRAEVGRSYNDLKECIDLIYVAAQYMNQAVGPEKAQLLFDAVHADNMNKCIDGKLTKNADGKILKPVGYTKLWEPKFVEILK